jgi:hypothetical protein
MTMNYDSYLDLSLDAYNESRVQLLDDRRVFEIAKRFELGDDQDEIRRFAEAIQEAFMEENNG